MPWFLYGFFYYQIIKTEGPSSEVNNLVVTSTRNVGLFLFQVCKHPPNLILPPKFYYNTPVIYKILRAVDPTPHAQPRRVRRIAET